MSEIKNLICAGEEMYNKIIKTLGYKPENLVTNKYIPSDKIYIVPSPESFVSMMPKEPLFPDDLKYRSIFMGKSVLGPINIGPMA